MLVVVFAFLYTLSTWSFAGGVAFLFAGAVWAAVGVFGGRLAAFTFELAASALACAIRFSWAVSTTMMALKTRVPGWYTPASSHSSLEPICSWIRSSFACAAWIVFHAAFTVFVSSG